MKKVILCLAVVAVTIVAVLAVPDMLSDNEPTDPRTKTLSLYSDILKEGREVIVRLPRLYDSTREYPVFYALDATSLDRPLANKIEILSDAGVIPEAIVVGIPNMTSRNRALNLTPPFMRQDNDDVNSPKGEGDRFLNFMKNELIPFVEQRYRSSSRVFCGNSRGGLIVMYSLIHTPDLFDARFCFSTPFWRQDDILIDSIAAFVPNTDSTKSFVYVNAGSEETDNIKGGTKRVTEMLQKISSIIVYSSLTPQTVHENNAQVAATEALVRWGEFVKAREQDSNLTPLSKFQIRK